LVKFNKIIVFYLLFNKKGYIAFLCALYYIMSRRFETLYPSAKPAWWKSGLIPPTMFADPPMADPPPSMIEAVAPLIQLVDIAVEPIEPYPAKVSKPYFEPWNYETLYRFWDAGDNTVRDNPKITHKNKPHKLKIIPVSSARLSCYIFNYDRVWLNGKIIDLPVKNFSPEIRFKLQINDFFMRQIRYSIPRAIYWYFEEERILYRVDFDEHRIPLLVCRKPKGRVECQLARRHEEDERETLERIASVQKVMEEGWIDKIDDREGDEDDGDGNVVLSYPNGNPFFHEMKNKLYRRTKKNVNKDQCDLWEEAAYTQSRDKNQAETDRLRELDEIVHKEAAYKPKQGNKRRLELIDQQVEVLIAEQGGVAMQSKIPALYKKKYVKPITNDSLKRSLERLEKHNLVALYTLYGPPGKRILVMTLRHNHPVLIAKRRARARTQEQLHTHHTDHPLLMSKSSNMRGMPVPLHDDDDNDFNKRNNLMKKFRSAACYRRYHWPSLRALHSVCLGFILYSEREGIHPSSRYTKRR
jgi:hypothetical protein